MFIPTPLPIPRKRQRLNHLPITIIQNSPPLLTLRTYDLSIKNNGDLLILPITLPISGKELIDLLDQINIRIDQDIPKIMTSNKLNYANTIIDEHNKKNTIEPRLFGNFEPALQAVVDSFLNTPVIQLLTNPQLIPANDTMDKPLVLDVDPSSESNVFYDSKSAPDVVFFNGHGGRDGQLHNDLVKILQHLFSDVIYVNEYRVGKDIDFPYYKRFNLNLNSSFESNICSQNY